MFEFNTGIIGGGLAQILDAHTDLSLFQTNMLILSNTSFTNNTAKYGGKINILNLFDFLKFIYKNNIKMKIRFTGKCF